MTNENRPFENYADVELVEAVRKFHKVGPAGTLCELLRRFAAQRVEIRHLKAKVKHAGHGSHEHKV